MVVRRLWAPGALEPGAAPRIVDGAGARRARARAGGRRGDATPLPAFDSDGWRFEGLPLQEPPRTALRAVELDGRRALGIARIATGPELPAATPCDVWDSRLPAGTPRRTALGVRVRMIVPRDGGAPLRQWADEARVVAAEWALALGAQGAAAPGAARALRAHADDTGAAGLGQVAEPVFLR